MKASESPWKKLGCTEATRLVRALGQATEEDAPGAPAVAALSTGRGLMGVEAEMTQPSHSGTAAP